MAEFRACKVVSSLPGTLVANTMYLVRVGAGFEPFFTNSSGTIVAYGLDTRAVSGGGTGATTAAGARDNLGLGNAALANASPFMCGRLTLESGTPNKIGDVTGASTLYLAPWRGNVLSIYNGTLWVPYAFPQLSLALSGLTSGKNYDVFAFESGGSAVIDLGQDWTNDTTRNTAVSLLNGIWVNTSSFTTKIGGVTVGANRGTLIGTIRATGTGTTEDSAVKRFVSNLWNPMRRHFARTDTTGHTYSANSPVRGWNNASTHTLEWVTCIAQHSVLINFQGAFTSSGAGTQGARLGLGTATTVQNLVMDFNGTQIIGDGFPFTVSAQAGYAIYYVTELATGSGNSTYYYYSLGGEIWN